MQLNTLSLKALKKPYMLDVDKLSSMIERNKMMKKFRRMGIEHLQLSKHLCNL